MSAGLPYVEAFETSEVVGALSIFCGGLVMAIDEQMPMAAEQLSEVLGHNNTLGVRLGGMPMMMQGTVVLGVRALCCAGGLALEPPRYVASISIRESALSKACTSDLHKHQYHHT